MTKTTFEVHFRIHISRKKTNILIFIKSSFWIKCNYGGIDNHYRAFKIFYDEVAAFGSNHRITLNHSLKKIIDEYLLNWINNQLCVFVSYERLVWYPCNLIIIKICKNQKLLFFNYYARYQENIVNENNQNPIEIPCKKINMIFRLFI